MDWKRFWISFAIGAVISVIVNVLWFSFAHAQDIPTMLSQTVKVETNDGIGSGVVIGKGTILTAKHVVQGKDSASIMFTREGMSVVVKQIVPLPDTDLAILYIDVPDINKVVKLSCKPLKVGTDIYYAGYPLGFDLLFGRGIISSSELYDLGDDGKNYAAETNIQHGNSGGPVFTREGELVAIAHGMLQDNKKEGGAISFLTSIASYCNEIKEKIR